jgi:hypothetical protein
LSPVPRAPESGSVGVDFGDTGGFRVDQDVCGCVGSWLESSKMLPERRMARTDASICTELHANISSRVPGRRTGFGMHSDEDVDDMGSRTGHAGSMLMPRAPSRLHQTACESCGFHDNNNPISTPKFAVFMTIIVQFPREGPKQVPAAPSYDLSWRADMSVGSIN